MFLKRWLMFLDFPVEEEQRGSVRVRRLRQDAIPSPIPASPCSSAEQHSSTDEPPEDLAVPESVTPVDPLPKVLQTRTSFDGKHLAVPGGSVASFLQPIVIPPLTIPAISHPHVTFQSNGTSPTLPRRSNSPITVPSKPGETLPVVDDNESEIFYLDQINVNR